MVAKILWWIYILALACAIILAYGMVENLIRKWLAIDVPISPVILVPS